MTLGNLRGASLEFTASANRPRCESNKMNHVRTRRAAELVHYHSFDRRCFEFPDVDRPVPKPNLALRLRGKMRQGYLGVFRTGLTAP
jgi:hypothetical protein